MLHTFDRHAVVNVDTDAGVLDVPDNFEDPVQSGVGDQFLLEFESRCALLCPNSQDDVNPAAVSLVVQGLVVTI